MHTNPWGIAATSALEAMQRSLDLPTSEQQATQCAICLRPPVIQAQRLAKRMQCADLIVDANKCIAQAMPGVRPRVMHWQPPVTDTSADCRARRERFTGRRWQAGGPG